MKEALATTNDETLLRLMMAGDAEAFAALYDRRQAGVYRFALRMSGSHAVAEDVAQDVFMALMRAVITHPSRCRTDAAPCAR